MLNLNFLVIQRMYPTDPMELVHSYYFKAKEDNNILAETDYGVSFPSVLCKDNILGTQFHPEKSQKEGVDFLKKFLMWKP